MEGTELEWKIVRPDTRDYILVQQLLIWGRRAYRILKTSFKTLPKNIKYLWTLEKILFTAENYYLEGEAKDSEWIVNNRNILETYLLDDMRSYGYIPILDMSTGLELSFNEEKETFNYKISVRAYCAGWDAAHKWLGIFIGQGIAMGFDQSKVCIISEL